MIRLRQTLILVLSFVICLLTTSGLIAQRGGGGAGGGGGFGGGGGQMSRMDLLTERFTLTKDQQKQVKTILDTEYKTAAPIRDLLKKTRTTLGLAIQNKKPQTEIDEAVKGYATQVTAMAEAETKALAKVAQALTPEQRGNAAAMQSAVYMMRGALANKKWDMVPDVWFY